ncbi:MAG: LysM peptidoglycan-binding domain-containing protein [Anaerolineales bacterium]
MPARRWIAALAVAMALAGCAAPTTNAPAPTAVLLALPSDTPRPPGAADTQAGPPPTPVIIATPTPTATPVTYAVQEGETLLGIAIKFGVSLEALQAANPTVEARFLSIGTVLIIPPPEGGFLAAATNLAPPAPAPVTLGQPTCYTLASGSLYCLLAAINSGELPLENVSVRLTLAGADGLPLVVGVAYAALDIIPPGEAAPLGLLVQPAPGVSVMAIGAEVLTANQAGEPAPAGRAVPLEIIGLSGQAGAGEQTLTAQARNSSEVALSAAWWVLTLYDADSRVIGYRKQSMGAGLAPAEVREITASAGSLAGPVDHFDLQAEGRP